MLGFKISEIESVAIKVKRDYWDLIKNEAVIGKSAFVESLTHDCYVVQIPRIVGNTRTRLEMLLSLFEQKYFLTDRKIIKQYNYPVDNDVIQEMLSILEYVASDEDLRKKIEDEQDAYRLLEIMAENRKKELEAKIKAMGDALADANQTITEQNQTIEKKDQALAAKDAEIEALRKKLGL
jgi:uncharacterized coiled-coil protein SlyX